MFAHTPLILNQEGRKLSKRDGVTSVNDFRGMGYTAEALANYMTLLGWSPPEGMGERFTLEEAAAVFGFERVNRAGARFDWDKLNWLNAQVLHGRGGGRAARRAATPLAVRGLGTAGRGGLQLGAGAHHAAGALPDAAGRWGGAGAALLRAAGAQRGRPHPGGEPDARRALAALQEALAGRDASLPLEAEEAQQLLGAATTAAGVKKGVLMKSLRAALLGSLQGPDLLTTWLLLQRCGEDLPRLSRCLR